MVSGGGRANHSVANAGNPSQGQDQSVNPVQSAEGLVRLCLSAFLLALLHVLFYVRGARKTAVNYNIYNLTVDDGVYAARSYRTKFSSSWFHRKKKKKHTHTHIENSAAVKCQLISFCPEARSSHSTRVTRSCDANISNLCLAETKQKYSSRCI